MARFLSVEAVHRGAWEGQDWMEWDLDKYVFSALSADRDH